MISGASFRAAGRYRVTIGDGWVTTAGWLCVRRGHEADCHGRSGPLLDGVA